MKTINREQLVRMCAEATTNSVKVDHLIQFFYESQYDWYKSLSDTELLNEAAELDVLKVTEDTKLL